MESSVMGILGILILTVIIILILQFVASGHAVSNKSMEPGLSEGECLLISKIAYKFNGPTRGEIVHYRPLEGGAARLHRIIGLPGDMIEAKNRSIYINGVRLEEPYARTSTDIDLEPFQVPSNNYFLMADNRNSNDESASGCIVPRKNIFGRAWIYAWPPDKWGSIDSYPLDQQIVAAESH